MESTPTQARRRGKFTRVHDASFVSAKAKPIYKTVKCVRCVSRYVTHAHAHARDWSHSVVVMGEKQRATKSISSNVDDGGGGGVLGNQQKKNKSRIVRWVMGDG